MIRPIMKEIFFLQQVSEEATRADLPIGQDLQDTLTAHRDHCLGMAANMIGLKKRIIIISLGLTSLVMYNPVLLEKKGPYQAEEGCLSLTGSRPTTRYQTVTIRFRDQHWQEQTLTLTDLPAQVVQHELDHLEGIVI
ncbi:peptide deformylase [Streptococcus sp. DD13]|uniref:peptide deformylase n=1 Tax=Streptococcus sp. DD13 TaxID=1777881 RepID=UPI000832A27D|nr:peptide deformylase [Streptococcus sp. DD13]